MWVVWRFRRSALSSAVFVPSVIFPARGGVPGNHPLSQKYALNSIYMRAKNSIQNYRIYKRISFAKYREVPGTHPLLRKYVLIQINVPTQIPTEDKSEEFVREVTGLKQNKTRRDSLLNPRRRAHRGAQAHTIDLRLCRTCKQHRHSSMFLSAGLSASPLPREEPRSWGEDH